MSVREMKTSDAIEVSRVVRSSFSDSVASGLSPEGISTFSGLSSPEALSKRLNEDNNILVYEEHGQIRGMIELKEGRHVAMFFVSPAYQGRGIGRTLMEAALAFRRVQVITVSASVPSVPAYQRYGFSVVSAEEEERGLRYVPMQLVLSKNS